jgi:hypothetical protein
MFCNFRNSFQNILMATYMDVSLSNSFKTLADEVESIVKRYNYYNFLLEDETKNRMLVQNTSP